jgi:spore coat polysaccharide biosynthesis protein SpsF
VIGAIVQARMGSTRLPGKVMLPAAGKPLLQHLLERLSYSKTLEMVAVASTEDPRDDVIIALCQALQVPACRGSDADVLDRYYQAAVCLGLDVVVRVTADCPLLDPFLLDEMVTFFVEHREQYALVTNRHPLTFPDGLDLDVMPMEALAYVWQNATEPHQREHTIPYFWEAGMPVYNFEHPDHLFLRHRWTLDYPEDYELIRRIYAALYRGGRLFTTSEILGYLTLHAELQTINARHLPTA